MTANVGVLVVTHGPAGADMLVALADLVGSAATAGFEALSVDRRESRRDVAARVEAAVRGLDRGAGVVVLCDLHGATPANCALDLKRAGVNVEVLCGLSLPMLVKLASSSREGTPARVAHDAAETAIRSIRLGGGEEP